MFKSKPLKGKAEPIGIYEPLGVEGEVSQELLEEIKLWNQALRYYRAQDWDQAEAALLKLSCMAPAYFYKFYTQRIGFYRKQTPGENTRSSAAAFLLTQRGFRASLLEGGLNGSRQGGSASGNGQGASAS